MPAKRKPAKSHSSSPGNEDARNAVKSLKILVDLRRFDKINRKFLNKTKSKAKDRKSLKGKIEKNLKEKKGNLSFLSSTPKRQIAQAVEDKQKTITPTKAQQKSFDTDVLKKPQSQPPHNIKRCVVKIKRENLEKLQTNVEQITPPPKKTAVKRKSLSPRECDLLTPIKTSPDALLGLPKPPRCRSVKTDKRAAIYFKLIQPVDTNQSDKESSKKKSKALMKKKKVDSKTKKGKDVNKIMKKSSTELVLSDSIKNYDSRFFKSYVRIERCNHPMMLIYESNERARESQKKRDKSRNCSVSFKDEVEFLGDTDTDEESAKDVSCEDSKLTVMPTRLKKIENGKVVEDIQVDTSLFSDAGKNISLATPHLTGGKRKRFKVHYSPLNDDETPSPLKEKFKLANEKLNRNYFSRLSMDDDDDEDEYIVPIEIPPRAPHNNPAALSDSSTSTFMSAEESTSLTTSKHKAAPAQNEDKDDNEIGHNINNEIKEPENVFDSLKNEAKNFTRYNAKTNNDNELVTDDETFNEPMRVSPSLEEEPIEEDNNATKATQSPESITTMDAANVMDINEDEQETESTRLDVDSDHNMQNGIRVECMDDVDNFNESKKNVDAAPNIKNMNIGPSDKVGDVPSKI